MKNMNLISGTAKNCYGETTGIVMTDLPREALIAMRDAINNILEKNSDEPITNPVTAEKNHRAEYKKNRETLRRKHEDAIRDAIAAAVDDGFDVDGDEVISWNDEDDWNDDEYEDDDDEENEEEEYNHPCENCRRDSCKGCRLY